MTKPFSYLLRVRYSECDAQAVVFNAKYVEFIDIAGGEYFRALWGDYKNLLEKGMDVQVVNVNVSWKAPALYDDVLALNMGPKRIGNSSFTLEIDFINYTSKQVIATGEITYVLVSVKEHQKMAIPDEIREQLETGASALVNHAGVLVGA